MRNRFLSIFTALTLCAAFIPMPALGEGATASGRGLIGGFEEGGAGELNNSYNKGEDSSSGLIGAGGNARANSVVEVSKADALWNDVAAGGEIKLTADIAISDPLAISNAVTLDLNGHVLKYKNDESFGSVIEVLDCGNLTIKDSNAAVEHKFTPSSDGLWVLDESNGTETIKGGIITGGTGTNFGEYQTFGGGVYVSRGGKLIMEGGNIVGCKAVSSGRTGFGGGVYLYGDHSAGVASSFVMNGGGIVGCIAELGGGVSVEPMCEFVMNSGTAIRDCIARNGGGVYINTAHEAPGRFTLNGGRILSCKTTNERHCRGGGVSNEGTFIMTEGEIKDCIAYDADSSGGVYSSGEFTMSGGVIDGNVAGSGIISLMVGVSTAKEFLDALANKNVTTIRLLNNAITVDERSALTIDRAIALVNGGRYAGCELLLHCPLTIAQDGELALEDNVIFCPLDSVAVEGDLAIGANCQMIFGGNNSSLAVGEGGTVKTVAAGEDQTPGLLSLYKDVALTVNGKLINGGTLSVSDMENLKKAAVIGGDLCLSDAAITEDFSLDMKENQLTIDRSLSFENDANLIVKNASKVDATGVSISGGSYYCPVYAGDETYAEAAITGGSFYGPVTVRWQGSSQGAVPAYISGGTFYGELKGASAESDYKIQGHTVTFMNDGDKYAMQVVGNGKASAPDSLSKDGYTFAGWYTEDGKKFDFNNTKVSADITLTARWTSSSSGWSPRYAIDVSDGFSHGCVAVSAKNAYRGATVTVTATPDAGYILETLVAADARGNKLELTDKGDGVFTFIMPGSKVEVRATFAEDNSLLNFFYDVPSDAYFYEAVKWAAVSGIVQGYGNGMFGPNDPCTRGQVVTFLWRAAGSPESSALSSFSDVAQDAYYAKAVAWAVEAGIAHGYSSDTFGPDDVCTRGQVATFLWRAAGSPESSVSSGFTDIAEGAYYSSAVAWAAEEGIACGYDNGTFGPDDGCTRGQAVTFLWRANR